MSEAELRELLGKAAETCAVEGFPAERDACIEAADLIETLQAQHERDGETIAKLTRDGSATYKRELAAIARAEAAEARLLPPVLTEEQREMLATAYAQSIGRRLGWADYDQIDRERYGEWADRFHAILTRIEGERARAALGGPNG